RAARRGCPPCCGKPRSAAAAAPRPRPRPPRPEPAGLTVRRAPGRRPVRPGRPGRPGRPAAVPAPPACRRWPRRAGPSCRGPPRSAGPARSGSEVNTALGLPGPGPPARARVLARGHLAGAGRAADRGVAVVDQRVDQDAVLGDVVGDLLAGPAHDGVDLDHLPGAAPLAPP